MALRLLGLAVVAAALVAGGVFAWSALAPEPDEPKEMGEQEEASYAALANAALGTGAAAGSGDYDYFWDGSGLVRARTDGSETKVLFPQAEAGGFVENICVDGDHVFCVMGRELSEEGPTVYRARTDGSELEPIFAPREHHEEQGMVITRCYPFEGRLYVVVGLVESGSSSVWRMDEDGSNPESLGTFEGVWGNALMADADATYYVEGSSVYARRHGEDAPVRIYEGTWNKASAPVPYEGRVYVFGSGGGRAELVSLSPDGSDASVVCEVSDGFPTQLVALADGYAYLLARNDYAEGVLSRASLAGGESPQVVQVSQNFLNNFSRRYADVGDHLIVVSQSNDATPPVTGVRRMEYDGTGMVPYMER